MKRFFLLAVTVFSLCVMSCSYFSDTPTANQQTRALQTQNQENAMAAYPAPKINNFLERKTIAEWTKRWDKPSIVTYCYVYIGQSCIGYFVTNGKPASTQSYLIPEDYVERHANDGGGNVVRSAMDLDGTYGSNNPGYRFFLANGTAVECSGAMVSCVYSDAPLSINVQEITNIK